MNDVLRMPVLYCIVGIVLAGLFEPIRADWWGLFLLGLLICLYGFLAKGEKDGTRFQVGDNCYFIGFVYTLSIITASLYLDAESLLAGAGAGSLHPLLKTIGIALGTSVFGMLWRFGLTYDVQVSEDRFDSEVHRAAVAAAELSSVVKGLQKTFADGSRAFAAQSEASDAHLQRLFEAFRSRLDKGIQKTVASLRTATEEAVANIGRQESSLTRSTAAYGKAVDASLGKITSSLDDYAASIHDAAQRVAATLGGAAEDAIGKFADGFSEALKANTATRDSLGRISSSLEDYAQAVHASAQRVGGALERAAQEALERIESRLEEALQTNTFADTREALDAVVRAHRESIVGVNQTLTSALTGLQEATRRGVAYAEEARDALAVMDGDRQLEGPGHAMGRFREGLAGLNQELAALTASQEAATRQMAHYRGELARLNAALEAAQAGVDGQAGTGFDQGSVDVEGEWDTRPSDQHRPSKRRWWRWWPLG